MTDDEGAAPYVPNQPTIAADLMLLLFNPRNGTIAGEGVLYYPLGGAVLAELALNNHIQIESGGTLSAGKVTAVGPGPQDPLLRDAWERLEKKPQAAQNFLAAVGPQLRGPVLDRIVARHDIVRTSRKVLRIFTTTKLTDGGTARRPELVSQMTAVLIHGLDPSPRTAVLGALLSASGQLHSLHRDIPWSSAVAKRGKELEKGDWAAHGVSTAVRSAAAAVATSVVLTTAAVATTN
ncbi:GPP34 family phosphoprotein [Demequina sp. B12]|uniref:GOLPH3/VPS74 family protein n=1 Tax=Demequina sp. B12 TaxID=2992757 RepID=UPI00237ACB09|nr:GPP34 family phosphoprotein [Demequina sp. B12]MDE0571892.1 GPP34 family phosphoprotein [Demequina sp. B12]